MRNSREKQRKGERIIGLQHEGQRLKKKKRGSITLCEDLVSTFLHPKRPHHHHPFALMRALTVKGRRHSRHLKQRLRPRDVGLISRDEHPTRPPALPTCNFQSRLQARPGHLYHIAQNKGHLERQKCRTSPKRA